MSGWVTERVVVAGVVKLAGRCGRASPAALAAGYTACMEPVIAAANDEENAARLRRSDIAPTAQRLKVAALLFASHQHLTAEQLLASLSAADARVSKATLYNTLNLFAQRGLVRELAVDGARCWFDTNVDPHYHFQELQSGTLCDIAAHEVQFSRLPEPPAGMEVAGIDVVIRLRHRQG